MIEPATPTPADPMVRMREMLMTQATDLDVMFAELIGKAATDLDKWPSIAERYVRLALRAQANCRASLDTLARAERARQRALARENDAQEKSRGSEAA